MSALSKRIKINDVVICYTDNLLANRPVVIFLHGFPFNKEMWNSQIEMLDDEFRVVAIDIRGHGESELGHAELSIDLFVNDLIGLMDQLKIEKTIICGLSMGGYIALNAMANYSSRIQALALCNTQCTADNTEGVQKRMLAIESIKANGLNPYAQASLLNLFAAESFRTKKAELTFIHETILRTNSEAVIKTLSALASRTETCSSLPTIKVPVLIIVGQEDKITPIDKAKFMKERISNSKLVIIPKAGHLSNLENPSEFNYQLKGFLNSIN